MRVGEGRADVVVRGRKRDGAHGLAYKSRSGDTCWMRMKEGKMQVERWRRMASISFLFSSFPFPCLYALHGVGRGRRVGLELSLNWIGATGLMAGEAQMGRTELGWRDRDSKTSQRLSLCGNIRCKAYVSRVTSQRDKQLIIIPSTIHHRPVSGAERPASCHGRPQSMLGIFQSVSLEIHASEP